MSDKKKTTPTFVVQIKGTANHTWQGTIKWIEEDRSIPFRSALEMLQLMDSAVRESVGTEDKVDSGGNLHV